ncbi:MAG: hypothetical protein ACO1NZ_14500 [Adhaeribacter sp.]
MKILSRLSLLLLLFVSFACAEEEAQPQVTCPGFELAGKWVLVKVGYLRRFTEGPATAAQSRQSYEIQPDSTFRYTHEDGRQASGRFTFKMSAFGTKQLLAEYQQGGSFKLFFPLGTPFRLDMGYFVEDHSPSDLFTYFYQKVDCRQANKAGAR